MLLLQGLPQCIETHAQRRCAQRLEDMALELIESDKLLKAVKPGDGRLSDGGGLYLLPTAKEGGLHGWRFDYTFEMRRKTLSFGTYPAVSLDMARTGRARRARSSQKARTPALSASKSEP